MFKSKRLSMILAAIALVVGGGTVRGGEYGAMALNGNGSEPSKKVETTKSNGWTPLRGSICRDVAWPPRDKKVYGFLVDMPYGIVDYCMGMSLGVLSDANVANGLRMALFNQAKESYSWEIAGGANAVDVGQGFQIGGMNLVAKTHDGAQIGVVINHVKEKQNGLQLAGIANVSTEKQYGVRMAGGMNQARVSQGLALAGLFNLEQKFDGFQMGTVNVIGFQKRTRHDDSGAGQMGLVNWVERLPGKSETGTNDMIVQLGVLNVVDGAEGIQFGLLNVNPKGFLPAFPFVNFNL